MFKLTRRRHGRTVFLAIFAALTFVICAVVFFDVDPGELLAFLLYSIGGLLVVILAAALVVGAAMGLKRLLQK